MNFALRLCCGVASGALLFTGLVLVLTGLNQDHQLKARARGEFNRTELQRYVEGQLGQTERQLAEARYQNGCVLVQDQLVEGMQVLGVTDNTFVCDVYGLTAVTGPDGVIHDIARTPDKSVVAERTAR